MGESARCQHFPYGEIFPGAHGLRKDSPVYTVSQYREPGGATVAAAQEERSNGVPACIRRQYNSTIALSSKRI